jgi:hypothetical protein
LAPADFFFVPEVEIHSERSPISDDRRDRRKFTMGPSAIPQNAFQNWKKHWKWCIDSGERYIEGDKS